MGDGLTDVALLYDAMPEAGLGHRRRMEALAGAFTARGCSARLRGVDGHDRADIAVVDSYRRRADEDGWLDARVVAAVDDLDRDLDVDLLVDPSPGSTPDPHRRARLVLAGAPYALVGPGLPASWEPASDVVRHVLVTLGAHDAAGLALAIANSIAARYATVDVAVTPPPGDTSPSSGVRLVHASGGLGTELAGADIVVCAGGVTLLEALRLGRPTVVVVVADNQRRAAEAVAARGAAVLATTDTAADEAVALAPDAARRAALATAASSVIDGGGPGRVADALLTRLQGIA